MGRAKRPEKKMRKSDVSVVSRVRVMGCGLLKTIEGLWERPGECSLYKETNQDFAEISGAKSAKVVSESRLLTDFDEAGRRDRLMLFARFVYSAFSAIVDTALQEAGHVQTRV